ncbi:hypothetical protein AAKU61_000003 [Undibacterium sp. GrIS 1.2]|uniref:plasmid recombination protein n=1 Tax=Undibacterium sp. GrIS 1.2 TaxID=3143933 RepID=UPI00339AC2DE
MSPSSSQRHFQNWQVQHDRGDEVSHHQAGIAAASYRGCRGGATMTQGSYYLEVKPLSKETTRSPTNESVLLRVMQHNLREIQAEIGIREGSNIDASRCHLNEIVRGLGTAAAADQSAKLMFDEGVKKIRLNASLGIEVVMSLGSRLRIDYKTFFEDCTSWAENHYAVPILSSIVHNDESCPHCHIVLLPIRDGKLIASDLLGGMAETYAMQSNFYAKVGKKYGLAQQSNKKAAKRPSKAIEREIRELMFNALQPDCAWNDEVLRALVNGDSVTVLALLDIPMPKGGFAEIMTKKVKPEKPIGHFNKSPIGHFTESDLPESEPIQNVDSEGQNKCPISVYRTFVSDTVLLPESEPIQSTESSIQGEEIALFISANAEIEPELLQTVCSDEPIQEAYQRESDSDQSPESFNEITGEFIKIPKKVSMKPAIRKAVANSLNSNNKTRTAPRPTYHARN